MLGLSLGGSFAIEQLTNSEGQKILRVGVSGGSLDLAGGLVTGRQATGLFVLTPGGVAGSLSAAVGVDAGAAISLSGSFSLAFNNTLAEVSAGVQRGGGAGPPGRP